MCDFEKSALLQDLKQEVKRSLGGTDTLLF